MFRGSSTRAWSTLWERKKCQQDLIPPCFKSSAVRLQVFSRDPPNELHDFVRSSQAGCLATPVNVPIQLRQNPGTPLQFVREVGPIPTEHLTSERK